MKVFWAKLVSLFKTYIWLKWLAIGAAVVIGTTAVVLPMMLTDSYFEDEESSSRRRRSSSKESILEESSEEESWFQEFSSEDISSEISSIISSEKESFVESSDSEEHEHAFDDGVVTKLPTCTEYGVKTFTCSCGEKQMQQVKYLGHDYQEGTCARCFAVDPEWEITNHEHVYEETILRNPTCTRTGVKSCVCACGENVLESIPMLEHKYVGGICSACGAVNPGSGGDIGEPGTASEGLSYAKRPDSKSYAVTGMGTCKDTNLVVPAVYEGLPVVEIKERAFENNTIIITVKLPDSIISIGNKAFSGCTALIKISMPEKAEVGTDVFRGSIHVEVTIQHLLYFVEAQEATCRNAGNIAYYACSNCDKMYEDEMGIKQIYNVTIPAAHTFVGGTCTKCGEILSAVKIVSVDKIPELGKFPLGTLENAIGLPEYVNVQTADGRTHSLKVQWDLSSYNKSKVGKYVIKGHVQAGNLIFDSGVSSQVQANIEIVATMKGTADIVFIIDTSGSMSDELANVKNNIIKLAQALEDKGVSARWGLVDYSDWEDVYGEETRIWKNGAANWFISAEEYKTAISKVTLRNGGDTPELAVDGLMAAMSLETRKDARTFYVLVTDADYKNDNKYGVSNMNAAINRLNNAGVCVSVVTNSSYRSDYQKLVTDTDGILTTSISGNFMNVLYNDLVEKIYADVIA